VNCRRSSVARFTIGGSAIAWLLARSVGAEERVTWSEHIRPIVHQHCIDCHRPGGAAPFSLVNYGDAAKRARMLAEAVSHGYMPPWKPVAGWGEFHAARHLDPASRAQLITWSEHGAPPGPTDTAAVAPEVPTDNWALGKPDLILRMPEPFRVPAEGPDVYRAFVLPFSRDQVPPDALRASGLPGVVGVRAVEIRPGNRRVVHHALGYVDTSGEALRREESEAGPGYTSFGSPGFKPAGYLGTYVPGYVPRPLPPGIDEVVPVNGHAVLQVHYSPTGKEETDMTEIGVYFSREPVIRAVVWWTLQVSEIDIPAGESAHLLRATRVLPADALVFSVLPHMHYLGKSVRAVATRPDGTEVRLLRIDDWDFNWQSKYDYRTPFRLPAGTRIDVEWVFDNSAENPRNPSTPPRRILYGPNSTDEMCEFHLNLVPVDPADYGQFGEPILGRERAVARDSGANPPPPAVAAVVPRPSREVPGLHLRTLSIPEDRLRGVSTARELWVAQHETTQGDYVAIMGHNPSRFGGTQKPVESVSWHEANAFCARLNAREQASGRLPAGWRYRLPTEAEWELACRAGSTGDYAGTGKLDDMGWHAGNSGRTTHEVGLKQPNAWGIYDAHGNVWEWCLDELGPQRVFRGGSCIGLPSSCRSWSRSANTPDARHHSLGFRVVLAAE
jgi:mono/diheme cytochrome c family protein